MSGSVKISFTLNGKVREAEVDAGMRLLDMLRNVFGMTSVKEGCGEGECGACTVLLDGEAVLSCAMMAFQVRGREVVTLEGISPANGELHPIQKAFIEHDAVQCGFCTPGMIMSAKALLDSNPAPNESEIREAMAGNLCRCTGYIPILEAVESLAAKEGAK